LKLMAVEESAWETPVAPHAGAWIETPQELEHLGKAIVAPHAGAWIETLVVAYS